MTHAQPIGQPIHRDTNGSIDFDFYRARAAELRRKARRGVLLNILCVVVPAMLAAVTFFVAVEAVQAPNGQVAVTQSNPAPIR